MNLTKVWDTPEVCFPGKFHDHLPACRGPNHIPYGFNFADSFTQLKFELKLYFPAPFRGETVRYRYCSEILSGAGRVDPACAVLRLLINYQVSILECVVVTVGYLRVAVTCTCTASTLKTISRDTRRVIQRFPVVFVWDQGCFICNRTGINTAMYTRVIQLYYFSLLLIDAVSCPFASCFSFFSPQIV